MSNGSDPWANIPGGYDGSRPGGPGDDDFGDLDSFGGDYRPGHAFRLGIESLADGQYDLEIRAAALEKTPKTGDRICRITLQVLGGGQVEWTHWLNRPEGVNGFCADLAALGFDAHLWNTPQRPLSKEVPAAVAKLAGIKFRGTKTSRKDNRPGMGDRVYHDLRVSCRIEGRPMPPQQPNGSKPSPQKGTVVGTDGAGAPVAVDFGQADDKDIPF